MCGCLQRETQWCLWVPAADPAFEAQVEERGFRLPGLEWLPSSGRDTGGVPGEGHPLLGSGFVQPNRLRQEGKVTKN